MYSCFAIRLRRALLCALVFGVSGGLVVSGLSAQTHSDAIASLQPVKQADRISANADYRPLVALQQKLPAWARQPNQVSAAAS